MSAPAGIATALALMSAAVTVLARGPEPQMITLTNGALSLEVHPPDATNGFYRGTRFDWSGMIGRLEYQGHRFYGPWFTKTGDVRDFVDDGTDITAGPQSAATGPAEEFSTNGRGLGWDDAAPGGTFVKIGVGVLRKPDDGANYSAFRAYEVVDRGSWKTEAAKDTVTFTHELKDSASGYAYRYQKTIRFRPNAAEMVIAHTLYNTGTRAIGTRVYDHNFLVLDGQPTGPDFVVTLPFDITTTRPPNAALAEVAGRQIRYKKVLAAHETVSIPIQGFGTTPADYRIDIDNARTGAGLTITGDRPLASLSLWSIRSTLAVEPFIELSVAPEQDVSWQYTYAYRTVR